MTCTQHPPRSAIAQALHTRCYDVTIPFRTALCNTTPKIITWPRRTICFPHSVLLRSPHRLCVRLKDEVERKRLGLGRDAACPLLLVRIIIIIIIIIMFIIMRRRYASRRPGSAAPGELKVLRGLVGRFRVTGLLAGSTKPAGSGVARGLWPRAHQGFPRLGGRIPALRASGPPRLGAALPPRRGRG